MKTAYAPCLLLLMLVAGCPSSPRDARPGPPAHGPAGLQLELPVELEPQRAAYRRRVEVALQRALAWFARHGFQRPRTGVVRRVVIFGSKQQMKRRLSALFKISPQKIPETFGGTVQGQTLLLVKKELFAQSYASLYPKQRWSDETYTRLMIHELAHRIHAMLATELFGSEDGMGPRWFFEGLAIACAGQFPGLSRPPLSLAQLSERVQRDREGIQSYPIYKQIFRSLEQVFPLQHLLRRAGRPGLWQHIADNYLLSEYLLEHPTGRRPRASVLLIHGSAPFNLDGRVPVAGLKSPYARSDFYRDLSEALRRAGFSVLRYSKPGVSRAGLDRAAYAHTDYALLARQLHNLWRFLPRDRPRLVFAWSEGTLHVRALPSAELDGVVLLGGIATNISAVIKAQGGPPAEALQKMLSEKKRTEMLGLDRPVGRLLDELAFADNHRSLSPHKALPLLVLHGTADREVPLEQARRWKRQLPGHAVSVVEGQGRDHRFMKPGIYEVQTLAQEITRWAEAAVFKGSRIVRRSRGHPWLR